VGEAVYALDEHPHDGAATEVCHLSQQREVYRDGAVFGVWREPQMRHAQGGASALPDGSRAPHSVPLRTSEAIERIVVKERRLPLPGAPRRSEPCWSASIRWKHRPPSARCDKTDKTVIRLVIRLCDKTGGIIWLISIAVSDCVIRLEVSFG
jgi:hypothetical protein